MTDYLADVRRYDATANADIVGGIVKHLGVALHNPDSASVSGDNPKELERIRESWCAKKLGVTDADRCDTVIRLVGETMAGDKPKSRVTFYYLVAKHLGKLGEI